MTQRFVPTGLLVGKTLPMLDIVGRRSETGARIAAQCKKDPTPVLAEHTTNLSLVDILAVGVDRMQRKFDPMRKQVEAWKGTRLPNDSVRLVIYQGHISSLRVRFCCVGCPQNRDELSSRSNFLITFPLLKASL